MSLLIIISLEIVGSRLPSFMHILKVSLVHVSVHLLIKEAIALTGHLNSQMDEQVDSSIFQKLLFAGF